MTPKSKMGTATNRRKLKKIKGSKTLVHEASGLSVTVSIQPGKEGDKKEGDENEDKKEDKNGDEKKADKDTKNCQYIKVPAFVTSRR